MAQPTDHTNPPLEALFRDYLRRQTAACEAGAGAVEVAGDVLPYEAVPLQPADPLLAWHDALAAVPFFTTEAALSLAVPPEWPTLVAVQEPAVDLAFCLGNFPQMVRLLQPLLAPRAPLPPLSPPPRPLTLPGSGDGKRKARSAPEVLLEAALQRLARQFETAEALLAAPVPEPWQGLWANERAALDWQRGRHAVAFAAWQNLEPVPPVLFNCGMAATFLGRGTEAKKWLSRAVAELPETSTWHHLGHVYLALAEARA